MYAAQRGLPPKRSPGSPRARSASASLLAAVLLAILFVAGAARADLKGDVDGNGRIDVADGLLLSRYLAGAASLTLDGEEAADVAPVVGGVSTPNGGPPDAGDLVVLLRVLAGELVPAAPTLDPITTPLGSNPIAVSGSGPANTTITLFVGGVAQQTVDLGAAPTTFTFSNVYVTDSPSPIFAVATDPATGFSSSPSNVLERTYLNSDDRTLFTTDITITGPDPVVWTPGNPAEVGPNFVGPYVLPGNLTVAQGATLVLMPGTEVAFADGKTFTVQGALLAIGDDLNPITLRGDAPQTTWKGIDYGANYADSRLDLQGVVIQQAEIGVDVVAAISGSTFSVVDSRFEVVDGSPSGKSDVHAGILFRATNDRLSGTIEDSEFVGTGTGTNFGVVFDQVWNDWQAGVAFITLLRNDLHDLHTGVWIFRSAPDVLENAIRNNYGSGIEIEGTGSGPRIRQENQIVDNAVGVLCREGFDGISSHWSGFDPMITGNRIAGNTTNLRVTQGADGSYLGVVINATANDWGVYAPTAIESSIDNLNNDPATYQSNRPLVDFTPFVDSGGSLVKSYAQGQIGPNSFESGQTQVIGPIVIARTKAAVIPEGVTLPMPPGSSIDVHGRLLVQGTASDPVVFRSENASPQPGDWQGIQLFDTFFNPSSIDWATIQHATRAIDAAPGARFDLTNSRIEHFSEAGLYLDGVSDPDPARISTIASNIIDNFPDETIFAADGTEAGTGIHLVDSSPHITGNQIQDLQVGIHVTGASNPAIDGGNVITENTWGIWIQGPGLAAATANPQPVIHGNDIFQNDGSIVVPPPVYPETPELLAYLASPAGRCDNRPANLCVSDLATAAPMATDATGNWWGSPDLATLRSDFAFHPQSVPEIDIEDYLDASVGAGGTPVALGVPAWVATVFGVSHDPPRFAPRKNEVVHIRFSTAVTGTAFVRIYGEDEDLDAVPPPTPRRTLSQAVGVGPQTIDWDGKDESGVYVPDEAYAYEIELEDAGSAVIGSYKPQQNDYHFGGGCDPAEAFLSCIPLITEYNSFRNDFWKHDYELIRHGLTLSYSNPDEGVYPYRSFPSRVTLQVKSPPTGPPWNAFTRVPVLPGPENRHRFVFDGRDPNGNLIEGDANFYFRVPEPMKLNAVLVDGTTPRPRGAEALVAGEPAVVPSIEVKANPFLVQHSYEQVTHLAYQLNTRARVSIAVKDPSGTVVDTPLPATVQDADDGMGQALVHVVTWTGVGSGAGESNDIVSTVDGVYTFEIRAEDENAATLFSAYQGVIQVRQ